MVLEKTKESPERGETLSLWWSERIIGILLIFSFSELNHLNFYYLAEYMEIFGITIPSISLDSISEHI